MLSHNEGLYHVFTNEQVERAIAASAQMPSLEELLSQLTTYHTEQVMENDAARINACRQLVDAAVQHDFVTNLYDGNFDDLMINAANIYQSKGPQNESYIVEGDFSNLFNCNQAISKKRANEIMAIIIDMYQQAFKHLSPPPHLVYGSRSGGDEFRFMIAGISEEKLKTAIQSAREKIDKFVEEMGLSQIEHSKYPGNPVKAGIGAEVAYKKLPVEFPSYELESELDEAINKNKFAAGEKKVQRGLTNIENPTDIANSPERLRQVDEVLEKYKLTAQQSRKAFPFHGLQDEIIYGNLFQKRVEQVRYEAGKLNMNEAQTDVFLSLLDNIYDKRDEKTGMMRNRDFIAAMQDFMSQAKTKDVPCFVLKMEAHNFSSLNELFSHFGNDVIFRHMADITARHLDSNTVSFSRGGGIISPVAMEKTADQINLLLEKIIDEFHKEIGNKTIAEYCRQYDISYSREALKKLQITEHTRMNQIPSIRGLHAGSGFIISITDIRKSASYVDVLNTLDELNEQNKKLGLALKTSNISIDLSSDKHHNTNALRKFAKVARLFLFKSKTPQKAAEDMPPLQPKK